MIHRSIGADKNTFSLGFQRYCGRKPTGHRCLPPPPYIACGRHFYPLFHNLFGFSSGGIGGGSLPVREPSPVPVLGSGRSVLPWPLSNEEKGEGGGSIRPLVFTRCIMAWISIISGRPLVPTRCIVAWISVRLGIRNRAISPPPPLRLAHPRCNSPNTSRRGLVLPGRVKTRRAPSPRCCRGARVNGCEGQRSQDYGYACNKYPPFPPPRLVCFTPNRCVYPTIPSARHRVRPASS